MTDRHTLSLPHPPAPCENCLRSWRGTRPLQALGFCWHHGVGWRDGEDGMRIVERMSRAEFRRALAAK